MGWWESALVLLVCDNSNNNDKVNLFPYLHSFTKL